MESASAHTHIIYIYIYNIVYIRHVIPFAVFKTTCSKYIHNLENPHRSAQTGIVWNPHQHTQTHITYIYIYMYNYIYVYIYMYNITYMKHVNLLWLCARRAWEQEGESESERERNRERVCVRERESMRESKRIPWQLI